ncbi:hypothetical protein VC273_16485 [Xanthomonas nasturtii]|uniref:hypothetical protein n=1 Tax=Xanthomonas TaxID=338 RepID=UPI002B223A38|nr:hypothetical protein [Xanthomonas nasturtii]MEA9557444.1 hypothetical protein [Xanthomonas nasturtii]
MKLPDSYVHRDERGYSHDIEKYLHPHQLELLARELLLHADRSGRHTGHSLANWPDFANVKSALDTFANDVHEDNPYTDIMLTLHRIAQAQFPLFSRLTRAKIGRYLAMYRTPALRAIFEDHLGIDVDIYFVLTFAVIASALSRVQMNTMTDYEILGVDRSQSTRFFERISGSLGPMRKKLIDTQRHNDCWEYTFNALHFYPLISLFPDHPERVLCPLPPALERRLLEGLYFDLVDAKGFPKAFGDAFESITGRILMSLEPRYEVEEVRPKKIKKLRYDGTDWIIRSPGNCAFVECKSKRLSLGGRVAEQASDLEKDIVKLAEAVIQNYANIHRELQAKQEEDCQYFNIIITLEDWILFSDITTMTLHDHVVDQLSKKGLPVDLIDKVPYRVLSFEGAIYTCATLKDRSMVEVFGLEKNPKFSGLYFLTDLKNRFQNADAESVGDFEEDFHVLMRPVIEQSKKWP